MLTQNEITAWYHRHKISELARAAIDNIRSSQPSRLVGGGGLNVSGRYPSKKMGVTIQFESHRVALAGIMEYENDDEVLEYYDQPPAIKLPYESATGRRMAVKHTPDFFVIRESRAGWEEWKTAEELERLALSMPNRYVCGDSNTWSCPPGEQYGADLSLFYRIRSSKEIDKIYQRNLVFLEDYLRGGLPDVTEEKRQLLLGLLKQVPGISLKQLTDLVTNEISMDEIFICLVTGAIFIDLHRAPLATPADVRVFTDKSFAVSIEPDRSDGACVASVQCGSEISWNGKPWTVSNVGITNISLLSPTQGISELPQDAFETLLREGSISVTSAQEAVSTDASRLILSASPRDLKVALKRQQLILDYENGNLGVGEKSVRSIFRYKAAQREAELEFNVGLIGLFPRISARGNRNPKLQVPAEIMEEHIKLDFETIKSKGMYASWLLLKKRCSELGVVVPSYKTYCKACKKRPRVEQIRKRKGNRAAYKFEEITWLIDRNTPIHGDRPFEIGHIDHTELDIELVGPEGESLGRPWLTLMIDAFSREILAFWLWFEKPSYRSCMMVIRECVRRHGRLPQNIVVDGGAEFRSTYFEVLIARCESTKKSRPRAKARFGSVIERMFGTTNTQFIHNLRGQTKIMRQVREVTKSVNPKNLATWTLRELHGRLTEYFFEIYSSLRHPALSDSPQNAFLRGIKLHGRRLHRLITYNRAFMILTLPSTAKGTVRLNWGRGVTVNYIQYWSDAFRDPEIENTDLPVRYDPFDADTIYVFCKNKWVVCHSFEPSLKGRTEREIQFAGQELRKNRQLSADARYELNAKTLGAFLATTEADEALQLQRAQARELASITDGNGDAADSDAEVAPVLPMPLSAPSAVTEIELNGEQTEALYGDL